MWSCVGTAANKRQFRITGDVNGGSRLTVFNIKTYKGSDFNRQCLMSSINFSNKQEL